MKSKNLLSTLGSIAAASMVIRTIVNDFLPPQVMNYFSCKLENLSHHFTSQITIVIEEFRGLAVNQVFEAVDIYLGSKTAAPSIQRVKVGKSEKDNKLALSMDRGGILVDVFEKVEMKWQLVCSPVDSVPSRNQNNGGDLNSSLRSEVRRYELSFHKRNKDLVIDSYLPYVLERAKLMTEEKKMINLHTVVYGRWDVEEIKLKHPMTFNTLAMDSELKRAVMVDLQHFTNGEEYYKRVGKAWKRGYLLYGPPGTGKSSLIAAMANYLKYDIYDLDLTDLQNRESETESDGNQGDNQVTLSRLLNCIDGLWSCCGEERIIIFTTNHKERLDPALVRPGRMDMHIHMSYCNVSIFKQLAFNYFGIGNDGVFEQIERMLEEVNVSPAEVAGELMKKNWNREAAFQGLLQFLHEKKERHLKCEEEILIVPPFAESPQFPSSQSNRGRWRSGRRGRGRRRVRDGVAAHASICQRSGSTNVMETNCREHVVAELDCCVAFDVNAHSAPNMGFEGLKNM
ncbi:pentatricopeptide repeat-containing protein [Hibiscus syriacus]|uniref:Pentatricopeptide repeat-containing protein n=1 Tax=Hibiscus syriacus TaxID=106335 RepID=A0A6A2YNE2_HIBSY|nr:pentatricopeptide repeat-containing protein [Hibiscus syriacus]